MIERAISQIRRLGSRAEVLGPCPVCGRRVDAGDGAVRAWAGKYAHRGCVSYVRRSRRREGGRDAHPGGPSQRIHSRFTAA